MYSKAVVLAVVFVFVRSKIETIVGMFVSIVPRLTKWIFVCFLQMFSLIYFISKLQVVMASLMFNSPILEERKKSMKFDSSPSDLYPLEEYISSQYDIITKILLRSNILTT